MKIDYELAEKIGATHYSDDCGISYYKLHNGKLEFYGIGGYSLSGHGLLWAQENLKPIKQIPKSEHAHKHESDYDRGMRKAMQSIAKSCGKVFGADIGYDDLPVLVESLVNPTKQKPPVRVEYKKVTDSIFDLRPDFEAGELYIYRGKHHQKVTNEQELMEFGCTGDLLRRIEKPVDWRDEVKSYLDSVCDEIDDDFSGMTVSSTNWEFLFNPGDDDFLEMCRIALRANGEL